MITEVLMKVTARGWSRDHGKKDLLNAELAYEDVSEDVKSFQQGKAYFQVKRDVQELPQGRRRVRYTARVSSHAELNLNGSYLVQLELSRQEIARLFYLTHGDAELPQLIKFFSELKHQERIGTPQLDSA
jgi:hypothetical protein